MKEKVDRSINRIDAPEKTGGYAEYIADMKFEGMLYAKTLRSEKPRAVIKSIGSKNLYVLAYISGRSCLINKTWPRESTPERVGTIPVNLIHLSSLNNP